jgi:large subunit ribosomal protein L3
MYASLRRGDAVEERMSEETNTAATDNAVNLNAFYGVKAGMTRIFDTAGNNVPVTVIKLIPNVISQVKTKDKDGYEAYQIAYGEKREKLLSKANKGHLKKANIDKLMAKFAEVKSGESVNPELLGKELTLENFAADSYVDVTGTSKGKGFQGVMKRHNFAGGPAAHGSHFHRAPGSVGMCATPSKIHKGKKMPGRMGTDTKTIQNLKVIELNPEQGYMLVKGSIPGSKNSFVRVSKAIKKA